MDTRHRRAERLGFQGTDRRQYMGMPEIDRAKRREVMRRSQALGHCICDPRLACPCPTLKNDDRCPCAGETAPPPPADSRVQLTQAVKAAGCGAKIGKAQLASLLSGLPRVDDPRVLMVISRMPADRMAVTNIATPATMMSARFSSSPTILTRSS